MHTSEAECTSEGIKHIQKELIILSKKVPYCLLRQPWAMPQESRHVLMLQSLSQEPQSLQAVTHLFDVWMKEG